MNKKLKFSLPLSTFSGESDRFVVMGYQESKSTGQLFDEALKAPDIQGIEFLGGTQLN